MRIRTPRGSGQIGYRPSRRRHDFCHPHAGGRPLGTFATWLLGALAAAACIAFPPTATLAAPDAPSTAIKLPQAPPVRG